MFPLYIICANASKNFFTPKVGCYIQLLLNLVSQNIFAILNKSVRYHKTNLLIFKITLTFFEKFSTYLTLYTLYLPHDLLLNDVAFVFQHLKNRLLWEQSLHYCISPLKFSKPFVHHSLLSLHVFVKSL